MFGTTNAPPNAVPRYNGAPRQDMMVVRLNPETGERSLDLLTWGLVPTWMKDLKSAPRPINAKSETVATNPMFKSAFAKRRCLFPVEAFFEWRQDTQPKQPFAIARQDRAVFAMAGLWESWQSPETKEWMRTFTVLTTSANSLVGEIHDRMPVILHGNDHAKWLGEETTTLEGLLALCAPFPAASMDIWPVSPRMNSWKYNAEDTWEPCKALPLNSL